MTETNTEIDPSLQPAKVNSYPDAKYSDSKRSFQGIPGIEIAANSRLWATWYSGGPEEGSDNYVVLATSADNGDTWSDLKLVIDPPGRVRAFDPVLWHDPLGRLWLFWSQSYDLWDGRGGVWAIVAEDSTQENTKWSRPKRVANGVMMNKPLTLSSGEWLLPAIVWAAAPKKSVPEEYKFKMPESKNVNVYASQDDGKTWVLRGGADIPVPEQKCPHALLACEHMLIEKNDKSLWVLARTPYGIGQAVSTDQGQTWTPGNPSTIPHVNSRFFIRRLKSGNLLLVRHDPPGIEKDDSSKDVRNNLKAFVSNDDGETWHGGLLIDHRETVSYPDGVEGPDGSIYIIYDYQRTGAKEIIMAVFTEQDIMTGECVSPNSRLRALVNKATGNEYSPEEFQAHVSSCFE